MHDSLQGEGSFALILPIPPLPASCVPSIQTHLPGVEPKRVGSIMKNV